MSQERIERFTAVLVAGSIATLFAILTLHPTRAECVSCAGMCRSNSECFFGCACATDRNTGWGQCVSLYPESR